MTGSSGAFLRFSRDSRGYEHFYLIQQSVRRGRSRSRLLYWFRTPPNVKVGRVPFDEEMRREIESRNPGVAFDWKRLLDTPIPPPAADVERWRERRREQRVARQGGAGSTERRRAEDQVQVEEENAVDGEEPEAAPQAIAVGDIAVVATAEAAADPAAADGAEVGQMPGVNAARKHRRRRGGRRRRRQPDAAAAAAGSNEAVSREEALDRSDAAEPADRADFEDGQPDGSGEGE